MAINRGKVVGSGRIIGSLVLISLLASCKLLPKKDDAPIDEVTPPPSSVDTVEGGSTENAAPTTTSDPATDGIAVDGAAGTDPNAATAAPVTPIDDDKPEHVQREEALRAAAEGEPGSAEAQFNLGAFLQESGNDSQAEKQYRTVLELEPKFLPAYVNLASVMRSRGQYARALDILAEGMEIAPSSSPLRNERVAVLRAMGRSKDAADEAHALLKDNSNDLNAFINLALCYHDLGNLDMSRLVFEKAMVAFPEVAKDSEVLHAYGVTLLALGERDLAIAAGFERALEVEPNNVPASVNRALLYLDDSKPAEAEKLLRNALDIEPGVVEARMALAVSLRRQSDFDGAKSQYELILASDPSNVDATYNLAVLYSNYLEDPRAALPLFEEVRSKVEDEEFVALLDTYVKEAEANIEVLKRRERLKQLRAQQAAAATPKPEQEDATPSPEEEAASPTPTPSGE